MIIESIVTSMDASGAVNFAPMGVEWGKDHLVLKPFLETTTFHNVSTTRTAVVNLDGKNGVFVAVKPEGTPPTQPAARGNEPSAMTAKFLPVETGIRDGEAIEIRQGLADGAQVITTGAGALKDGDRIVPASGSREEGRGGREGGRSDQRQGSTR